MAGTQIRPPGPGSFFSVDSGRTRRQFADQIRQFAQRTTRTHLFSGEHFTFLSEFFTPASRAAGAYGVVSQTSSASTKAPDFAPVYLVVNKSHLNTKRGSNTAHSGGSELGESSDEPRSTVSVVPIRTGDELESALTQHAPTPSTDSSLLVFMRGWQSPPWLRILGARCDIDPEMLRRHLGFLQSPPKFFDQPPLPSDQLSIWRIRTVTICELSHDTLNPEEVQSRRETASQDVRNYLQKLHAESVSQVGSSIVRRYSVIDGTTSVIEHDISFYANAKRAGGWIGTIWMDSGLPFESTQTLAPNARTGTERRDFKERYIPLVLHIPRISIDPPEPHMPSTSTPAAATTLPDPPPCPTLFNLPSQYGLTLDRDLARVDAFYAFSELMLVAARSENQLLNLLKEHIDVGLHAFHGVEDWSLGNLRYLTTQLHCVIERSEEVIYLLENEAHSNWPAAGRPPTTNEASTPQVQTRETTRKLLLDDYRFILRRARSITKIVDGGIAAINTEVMARDAQRSIQQGRRIGRITVLAYFFLPLAFVTSIFGMNFISFEETWKGAVVFVTTLIGIFVPAMIMCFWDMRPWKT